MHKNAENISYRRLYRKIQNDGLKRGIVDSAQTMGREQIMAPFLKKFIQANRIPAYDLETLDNISKNIYYLPNYNTRYDDSTKIPFVAHLSGGYAFPRHGIVLDETNNILNTIVSPQEVGDDVLISRLSGMAVENPLLFSAILRSSSKIREQAKRVDTVAPIFPYYSNYYHWLIKTLPKLRYIRHFEQITNREVKLLLPTVVPSWMEETLELLNVTDRHIIRPEENVYYIKNFILPSWVAHSADDYNWLKNNMVTSKSSILNSDKILISREDATDRQMTNQDEVANLLSKYGFNKYILSEISVEESIQLFTNADIVVGAHGAGLSDIIFMEEASVIELYGAKYVTCYKRIANSLGLKYTKLQCEPVYTDIRVDIEQLESAVQEAL